MPASRAGSSSDWQDARSSGSCTRARRRSAASRHVLTTSRCSHVENCAPPRNCFRRTHTFASASCAASLRVVGIAQDVPREPLDLRLVPGEQRLERVRVAVLRARHEHRVAQLLVRRAPAVCRSGCEIGVSHRASLVAGVRPEPEAVLPLLHGRFGTPYRYVESCPSTQRLLADDDPEGATVATRSPDRGPGPARPHLGGRRRAGRSSCPVLLRPPAPMPLWPELSLVAGEAVAARASRELGVDASLRHPNDVVVAGRKLVGVLPEASQGRVVLGIGVNVNQTAAELPADTVKPPTSVRIELGPRGRARAASRRDPRASSSAPTTRGPRPTGGSARPSGCPRRRSR